MNMVSTETKSAAEADCEAASPGQAPPRCGRTFPPLYVVEADEDCPGCRDCLRYYGTYAREAARFGEYALDLFVELGAEISASAR